MSADRGAGPGPLFEALVDAFAGRPGVSAPGELGRRGFGSRALKVDGKIFAMLTRDHLVVKLPRHRVTALIDDGTGQPFVSGKATPMREWLVVDGQDEHTWHTLAQEALAFTGTGTQQLSDIFARVSEQLLDEHPEDDRARMLRAPALKAAGTVYAFATGEDLVVKLPAARVSELIATGTGRPCDPTRGRPIRQWVRLSPTDDAVCAAYLREARRFVTADATP